MNILWLSREAGATHVVLHFPAVIVACHVHLPAFQAELVTNILPVAIPSLTLFWCVLPGRDGRAERQDTQVKALRLGALEEDIVVVGRRLRQGSIEGEWKRPAMGMDEWNGQHAEACEDRLGRHHVYPGPFERVELSRMR